jgi:PAS domain S-box-containing protein
MSLSKSDAVNRHRSDPVAASALLDAMSNPAAYVDPDLTLRYCNVAAARHLGLSVELLAGRSLREIPTEQRAVLQAVEGVLASGEPYSHTLWITIPAASGPAERGYRIRYQAHRDAGGHVIGCLIEAEEVTEQANLVAALEHKSLQYRMSFETLPQGVVICDRQGAIVGMNAVAKDILSEPQAAERQSFSRYLQERDIWWGNNTRVTDPAALPHERALRGETVTGIILSWQDDRLADRHWCAVSAAPVIARGRIIAAVTSFMDLPAPLYTQSRALELETQAVEVEELTIELEAQNVALHEAAATLDIERQQLQAVLSSLPVGVWIVDAHGRLIQKNQEADRIWSGDAPLLKDGNDDPRYAAWDAESGAPLSDEDYPVGRALRTGERVEAVELAIRRYDGSTGKVLVSAAPIKDEQGRMIGVVGVNVDVTERRRVEQALLESEERLHFIATHIPDTVFFQDLDLRYVWIFNPTPPFAEGAVVGKTDADLVPPEEAEQLTAVKRRVLETGQRMRAEVAVHFDGATHWYDLISEPWSDPEEGIIGVISYSRDITERKEAYDQIRRYSAELEVANDANRVLLQEVNHRVKNSLMAILGLILAEQRRLEASGQRADSEPSSWDALDNLAERVRSLATAHTLLSQSGWRPLPVSELVRAVILALAPALPDTHGFDLEITGPPLRISPEQAHHLALVISELTTNAMKYGRGPDGVHICVDIGLSNGEVTLVYSNEGPGYAEPVLAGERRSVGLDLVDKLARHSLRGTWALRNEDGPVAEIRFPIDPALNSGTAYAAAA